MSKTNNEIKPHRGRVQAQGGGIEKSEAWAQDSPLSLEEGLELIENLKQQLTKKELKKRKEAFEKLEKLVKNHSETGISHQYIKSFLVKDSPDERVDLEIHAGLAFLQTKTE